MQTRATSTLSVVLASLALVTSTAGCGGDTRVVYCVQGSTLHLLTVDTTMPMATIQSDIFFTK